MLCIIVRDWIMLWLFYVFMVNFVVLKLLVMRKICIKLIKLYNVEGRVNIYLKLDISEIVILIYGMILNFIIVK